MSPDFHAVIALASHDRLSRVRFSVSGAFMMSAEIYSGQRVEEYSDENISSKSCSWISLAGFHPVLSDLMVIIFWLFEAMRMV